MGMSGDGGAARRVLRLFLATAGVLALTPGTAEAATPAALDSGATAWVLVASALVLFMTLPGLALFYGGLVRARNLLSVLMHCFVISCIVSLLWVLFGYSLVFTSAGLSARSTPLSSPRCASI
jgi:Amt family ammonium transporter